MKVLLVSNVSKFLHGLSTVLILCSAFASSNPHSPSNPKLAGQIEQLLQKELSDDTTDTKTAPAARQIFFDYGVPTSTLVGPQAAEDYIVLASHEQALAFLQRLLSKLEQAAASGQVPLQSLAYLRARIRQKTHGSGLPRLANEPLGRLPALEISETRATRSGRTRQLIA